MFRRLFSLSLIAAFLTGQLLAVPHARCAQVEEGHARVRPHVHVRWASHSSRGDAGSACGHRSAAARSYCCAACRSTGLAEQSPHGNSSQGESSHDHSSVIYLPEANVIAHSAGGNYLLTVVCHFLAAPLACESNAAPAPVAGRFWLRRPPDDRYGGGELFLTLQKLLI